MTVRKPRLLVVIRNGWLLVVLLLVLELCTDSPFSINCLRVEPSASPVGCHGFIPCIYGKKMLDKHVDLLQRLCNSSKLVMLNTRHSNLSCPFLRFPWSQRDCGNQPHLLCQSDGSNADPASRYCSLQPSPSQGFP